MSKYDPYRVLEIKIRNGDKRAEEELERRKRQFVSLGLKGINNEFIGYVPSRAIEIGLNEIHRLYKLINMSKKSKNIVLLDSFHSATIEGARTTIDSVKRSIDRKDTTKDDRMVINSMKATNIALKIKLGMNNIRDIWEMIVKGVCENEIHKGKLFRDGMVYIGSGDKVIHIPEKPENISQKMESLFEFCDTNHMDVFLKAFIIQFYFVYIHPFCDGNGRLARILTTSYIYHRGYHKVRAISMSEQINSNLSMYYKSLYESEYKQYINGKAVLDITPFLVYMIEITMDSLLSSMAKENELNELEQSIIDKMRNWGNGASITVKKCRELFNINYNKALGTLNSLVDKGYLDKRKEEGNRNMYYLRF